MSTAPTPAPTVPVAPPRGRRRAVVALAVVALAVAGWQGWVHLSAWRSLKDGRAALERGEPEAARQHLARCLDAWPNSAEAHLLAGRAARRSGALDPARGHLARAEQLGRPADEVEVERLLLGAQAGDLAGTAAALLRHAEEGHAQTAEILALLVPAYLADFRIVEAGGMTARWVEAAPDSARAWAYRADVLERLRKKEEAVAALRRLVELAPNDRAARAALVRLLLETRQAFDEAAGHAEWLTSTAPADADAQAQLAACREAQGRVDEASALLDRAIAASGGSAKALHQRGKLEMSRGRPAEALPFLRRGADADPSDVELLYTLFACVQRTGTPDEARAAEERWKRADADLRRVAELARAVSAAPDDPNLRHEIGELFLRNGRTAEGVRWLESALRVDPDHVATRRALAAHYEKIGRPDLARRFGARATP